MQFSRTELRDLAVAWVALSLAFTFFFEGPGVVQSPAVVAVFVTMFATVGTGFLLHELAHKVVAVQFGQVAEFRADYGMLLLAVAGGLAGFIFAAPGAVHHRGHITKRAHGLVALAGPVTNLGLAAVFLPVALVSPAFMRYGVGINLLLAAFNMLPFGPLDGRTVLAWSKPVFAVAFAVPVVFGALLFVL
jgi:Zn-dependent protease